MSSPTSNPTRPTMPTPKLDTFNPALRHIVETVLRGDEDSTLVAAIHDEGHVDLLMLLDPNRDFFSPDGRLITGKKRQGTPVPPFQNYALSRIQHFVMQYEIDHGSGKFPPDNVWLALQYSDFNAFAKRPAVPGPVPSPAATPSAAFSSTPAQLFRKGIKRDPTVFPHLKAQKHFLIWRQSFESKIHAQVIRFSKDRIVRPSPRPEYA